MSAWAIVLSKGSGTELAVCLLNVLDRGILLSASAAVAELTSCEQTYGRQFQIGIVISFDIGLHHDPDKTVASQQ